MKLILKVTLLTSIICTTYTQENKHTFVAEKDGKDAFVLEIFKEGNESVFYLNDRGEICLQADGLRSTPSSEINSREGRYLSCWNCGHYFYSSEENHFRCPKCNARN